MVKTQKGLGQVGAAVLRLAQGLLGREPAPAPVPVVVPIVRDGRVLGPVRWSRDW